MRVLLMILLLVGQLCRAAPPVFAPVQPGRALQFPRDFGAHPDFRTEWWYVTGWLNTPDGKPLGFQVTFFRSATEHDRANPSAFAPTQLIIGHAALSDPALGHLVHDQRSARAGFGLAFAGTATTDVKLDDWRMRRLDDGSYRVSVRSPQADMELTLTPTQPVLAQGQGGFSRKGADPTHASYYYSEPQLKVTGRTASGGRAAIAVTGTAWLDHEWSSQALEPNASGWDWIGANLNDGSALMAFQIRERGGNGKLWAHAMLRDSSGRITQYRPDEVSFTPQRRWKSPRTGADYPVATVLSTGATRWEITPLQSDQELDSRRSTGAVYWEGAVTLTRDGQRAGRGYLEMTGYAAAMKL
ncbi:MAG: lipocalin-like domain-containing protein [Gammaproteobacteria bacterium]